MSKLTYPTMTSSALATRSRLLLLFTFVVLALMLVDNVDARTRTTRTIGGTSTDLHDHGIRVQCTWPVFEGAWSSDPEVLSVSHSAGDSSLGEYATCSGWNVEDGVTYVGGNVDHVNAPLGSGKFLFDVTYRSSSVTTCVDDDSGIGNDCVKFFDEDNTGKGGKKKSADAGTAATGGTLACTNNFPGTTLTYQFFCADGVDVSGYLTLVPSLDGGTTTQSAPDFTGPCGLDRVAAGDCTMLYGGVPMKTVKIKGVTQEVVDAETCLEAFPQALVRNALDSGQIQNLEAGAMLFYQEVAYTGSCDDLTGLPTEDGSPSVAHGRYCQSDISNFVDNIAPNIYAGDPLVGDGFDKELRICEMSDNPPPHTGDQDVETVELADIIVDAGPTFNLNCSTGGNTDSGKYKVLISDQATLLAGNVDVTPLSDAPTLEGVSPIKAVINTDDFGVDTLELVYPTCTALSANIIANNSLDSTLNNTYVTLELIGQTEPDTAGIEQVIKALIEVKVNGL